MLTKPLTKANCLEGKLLFYSMISTYDTRLWLTGLLPCKPRLLRRG
jgi:hypothetical protein